MRPGGREEEEHVVNSRPKAKLDCPPWVSLRNSITEHFHEINVDTGINKSNKYLNAINISSTTRGATNQSDCVFTVAKLLFIECQTESSSLRRRNSCDPYDELEKTKQNDVKEQGLKITLASKSKRKMFNKQAQMMLELNSCY